MSERRLIAVQFIPDENGGRWEPAAGDWVDVWEAGITVEEARYALESTDFEADYWADRTPGGIRPLNRVKTKLAAFTEETA